MVSLTLTGLHRCLWFVTPPLVVSWVLGQCHSGETSEVGRHCAAFAGVLPAWMMQMQYQASGDH